ncbi:hypothetical protein EGJ86_22160 [Pseudomonas sp. o96-267]|nr:MULTISPECIES: hypothetical protein [Pseudomonas]MDH0960925.1 hypothetical protein [Pseudomonas chengduensis]MDV5863657.1 hypothetical protein [Pseudomonas mendocina]RRV29946.1 hypothetical protein EGJ86_22160 [Pseudomonas sp. o96-267]
MSKVNLSTVLFYRGDAEHRPIEDELLLTGVEKLFPELRFPDGTMTFLYGYNSPALPYSFEHAGALGIDIAIVDVQVEIGKWLRHKADLSDSEECGLKQTRFLNLSRAKKEILDQLESIAVKRLGVERASAEAWPRGPTVYPYMLGSVLEHEEYSHLAVIAYTVMTATVGEVQVATVFDDSAIISVDGGHRLVDTRISL